MYDQDSLQKETSKNCIFGEFRLVDKNGQTFLIVTGVFRRKTLKGIKKDSLFKM